MFRSYKLGLTRNRLFEFDNAVLFFGKYDFENDGLRKALRLLCMKEPLVTSFVSLESDGEAYALTETVVQEVDFCSVSSEELKKHYEKYGVNIFERAFEFSYTSDGFLVIAAHTALSDAKALMHLASDLLSFYKEPLKSIEPSAINLISEKTDLPLEVASPIIDRLSAELDLKWQKDSCVFNVQDYNTAQKTYDGIRGGTETLSDRINASEMRALKEYCKQHNMDVVSLVGFAFYDALLRSISGKKKQKKMNVYADERLFFMNFEDYRIGAYNGACEISYKKKFSEGDFADRAKLFHNDCYKNTTSTLKVFFDEVLLMRISPSLCDAAYMYKTGLFKGKTARDVAENYSCDSERLCDYFYCNLEQEYWCGLKDFSEVLLLEPFKMRSVTALEFIMNNGEGYINFRYKNSKCEKNIAEKIMSTAIANIKKIS